MDKNFKGYLILNWKKGTYRATKKKMDDSPFEIAVEFNVLLKIPDKPSAMITGEVELPETKVMEAVARSI